MNLSILIHTFSGYHHLWEGQRDAFRQNWPETGFNLRPPVYFGTDVDPKWYIQHVGNTLYSGRGEWSNRLKKLLKQIPTDYVLYMQEDHWPKAAPPDLARMMMLVTQHELLRLQLAPINHFYTLTRAGDIHFFNPESKYLVSHQPSIWKKSFLLDCLHPNETPWVNEYKGTLRWQETSQKRDFIRNKIAIYPCDWFSHRCIKGKVIES